MRGIGKVLTVTIDSVVVQDSEPVPATVDEKLVLLSIRANSYFDFNQVGTDIWNLLGEPRSVREILGALSRRYDADPNTMANDVTTFLQTLIERRLIRVVEPGKSP